MPLLAPEQSTDTNMGIPYYDSVPTGTNFIRTSLYGVSDIGITLSRPSSQFEKIPDRGRQFDQLADEWHRDTDMISSPTRKKNHRAYRRILAMGMSAVPFILRDLRERGGDWYEALVDITGASPVPPDAEGDVHRMNECWFNWGREMGFLV